MHVGVYARVVTSILNTYSHTHKYTITCMHTIIKWVRIQIIQHTYIYTSIYTQRFNLLTHLHDIDYKLLSSVRIPYQLVEHRE